MADYPAPVATQIQPPDPTRGINTFSALLGIKQQQQALQTGQYLQQSAAANASQDQQKNAEMQAAQRIAVNGAQSGAYTNSDGTFNRQKMADDISKQGPYAQAMSSSLLSQANEIVQNQVAHQNLTAAQQSRAGAAMGALATKKDLTNSDFIDTMDALVEQGVVPRRMAMSMLTHLPPQATPEQLRGVARRLSIAATSPESSAGQTTPSPVTFQGPGGIQVGNVNPQAIGGAGPVRGAPMANTPGPTVVTNPLTQGQAFTGGALGNRVAPIGSDASWQPAPGQAQMQAQTAPAIGSRLTDAIKIANSTPAALDALNRARDVMDRGKWTGGTFGGFKALQNTLAGMGFDTESAADSNELVKNLARYEATRANLVGNTDAARSLVELGSPNTKIDATAMKHIITQSMANEMSIQGYTKAVGQHGNDPAAAQAAEARFRSTPSLIQAYEFGLMRNKDEADEFLQRHNISPKQLAESRKQLKDMGAL